MVNRTYCIHFCVGFEEVKSFKISQLQRFDQIGFTCRSVARCPFVQLDFRFSRHFSKYYKNYDANTKYNMYSNHSPLQRPTDRLHCKLVLCGLWYPSHPSSHLWLVREQWKITRFNFWHSGWPESIDSWSFIGFVLKFETCHIWNYLMMFYLVFSSSIMFDQQKVTSTVEEAFHQYPKETLNVTKSPTNPTTVKHYNLSNWHLHFKKFKISKFSKWKKWLDPPCKQHTTAFNMVSINFQRISTPTSSFT